MFPDKATGEHLHLLHRLLVSLTLGSRDSFSPGSERLIAPVCGEQRFPEELPCGGVAGIEYYSASQVFGRAFSITGFEILVAQSKAQ